MALTLSKVAAWQPNTLQACAENLAALNQELASSVGDLRTAKTRLSEAWEGWAADAAAAKTQRHAASGDDLVDVLTRTSQTFTWGRAALVAAQDALDEVVRAARAEGCTVDDDGTAHPPPISAPENPMVALPLLEPAAQRREAALALAQARAQAAAMAARYTRLIQGQLQAADATDAEVARTLSGIMLPTKIAESAAETAGAIGGVELGGSDLALQVAFPDGWQLSKHLRPLTAAGWTALVGAGSAAGLPIIASLAVKQDPTKNDDTGYYGGGAVEGPDGRLYPLVAPQVVIDGVLYGGDAQAAANRIVDLDGADNGWHTVGHTSAIDRIAPIGAATKVLAGAGALAGAPVASDPTPSRLDLRDNLHTNAGGFPTLEGAPGPGEADNNSLERPGKPFGDPRDNPIDKPSWAEPEVAGLHPDRAGRAQGGMDLLTNAGEGALLVKRLNDSESKLFDLTLEAHEDGERTRALLRVYDVEEDLGAGPDDPKYVIKSSYGWLDQDRGRVILNDYNFRGAPESAGPNARYHEVPK